MARKSQRGAGSRCAYRNPKSLKKSRKSQRGAGSGCGASRKQPGQNGGVCGGKHNEKNRQRGAGAYGHGHLKKTPRQNGGNGCQRKPAGQNAGGRGHSHGRHPKNSPRKRSKSRRSGRKSLVICGPEGCNSKRK